MYQSVKSDRCALFSPRSQTLSMVVCLKNITMLCFQISAVFFISRAISIPPPHTHTHTHTHIHMHTREHTQRHTKQVLYRQRNLFAKKMLIEVSPRQASFWHLLQTKCALLTEGLGEKQLVPSGLQLRRSKHEKELGRWPGRGHHFHTWKECPGKFESIWHISNSCKARCFRANFWNPKVIEGSQGKEGVAFPDS